ncbi:MAG: pyrroloquinoline-quinone synthase [Chloroflexota bacterium]|jgi:pyrroloquinoline quinone (PQQ) biosynthesis protein C|nr:pyrroloquinoline-quinone synthase [Chloroflexota bacterium]
MMNHPPYSAKDLSSPPLPGSEFVQLLQKQRQEKYPDPPGFYQALFDGTLKREFLELWIKNMYYYWDYGLQFSTGAIFVKTNEEATRTRMLRKLVCIEGKEIVNDLVGWTTPAYEELWLRLGEGLGLTRDEITSWKVFTRSYYAISTLALCSRWWEWSWLDGVASFYAGDQLGKELMSRTHDALKKHYGVGDQHLEFFGAYVGDVSQDIPWEADCLAEWACTTERQLTAARAFRYRLDIEYQMVEPLHTALTSERLPVQVP